MIKINRLDLDKKMYFGKTYCSPAELLETTINFSKLNIPHEVLPDEGAYMYSINWLFQDGILEYFKTFPETSVCYRTGRETAYKISINEGYVGIISPAGEVQFTVYPIGGDIIITSSLYCSTNIIFYTLKDIFNYEVK